MDDSERVALLAGINAMRETMRTAAKQLSDAMPKITEQAMQRVTAINAGLLIYANAIEAITEHFEAMLDDDRLKAAPETHLQITQIFRQIMDLYAGKDLTAITAISAFKARAKRGGLGKRAKSEREKALVRKFYAEHKSHYKNKDDAAFSIEGKTIDGHVLTATAATIRGYLRVRDSKKRTGVS